MFGLFKKKPTREECENAIKDETVYPDAKQEFENLINELSENNKLNIDIDGKLYPENPKWGSMKIVLG